MKSKFPKDLTLRSFMMGLLIILLLAGLPLAVWFLTLTMILRKPAFAAKRSISIR